MIRKVLVAGVFVFLAAGAEAASFDCKKAKTEVEKTICTSAELSRLDDRMAASYADAISKLSPEGKKILRIGQQRWLKFIRALCKDAMVYRDTESCLRQKYEDRISDLSVAALQVGNFVFSRVDDYDVILKPKSERYDMGAYIHQVSYPRIDMPANTKTRAWNTSKMKGIAAGYECDEGDGDTEISFNLEKKTSALVRVIFSEGYVCHSMGGGYEDRVEFIDLSKGLSPLRPESIFNGTTEWLAYLTTRSIELVSAKNPDLGNLSQSRREVGAVVEDIERWDFRAEGLTIYFSKYDLGGSGGYEITIPWSDLQPYLRPDAPIPR